MLRIIVFLTLSVYVLTFPVEPGTSDPPIDPLPYNEFLKKHYPPEVVEYKEQIHKQWEELYGSSNGLAICKYSAEEFKKSPMLFIYCIIFLALGVLILLHYILAIIRKLFKIKSSSTTDGLNNNEQNITLDEIASSLYGMFPIQSNSIIDKAATVSNISNNK